MPYVILGTRYVPAKPNFAANLKELQKLGISLTNYNAVTHPSEPNYIAAAGGDYFGLK